MSDAPLPSSSTSAKRFHDQQAADDGFDDMDDGSAAGKRRRMRYRVACLPCQRKKCKCELPLYTVLKWGVIDSLARSPQATAELHVLPASVREILTYHTTG